MTYRQEPFYSARRMAQRAAIAERHSFFYLLVLVGVAIGAALVFAWQ